MQSASINSDSSNSNAKTSCEIFLAVAIAKNSAEPHLNSKSQQSVIEQIYKFNLIAGSENYMFTLLLQLTCFTAIIGSKIV